MGHRARTVADWLLRNRNTGSITIAQFPNVPLWAYIVAAILRWILHPSGVPAHVLTVVMFVALVLWAVDEIARGVNPWRRMLGAGVLLWALASLLHWGVGFVHR